MRILPLISALLLAAIAGGCGPGEREATEAAAPETARTVTLPDVEVTNTDFQPREPESSTAAETPMTIAGDAVGRTSTISPAPPGATPREAPPLPGQAQSEGERIYLAHDCGVCHGRNGGGGTPSAVSLGVEPFTAESVQQKSDAELIRIILEGTGPASAAAHRQKNVRPEEASAVVQWIRTLR